MNKLSRDYKRLAEGYGFVLIRTRKHAIFRHKNGAILSCPSSPSDSRRGLRNLERDIRYALYGNNKVLQPGDRA